MSTYNQMTKNPDTGQWEDATWIDDYFGPHQYGVRFPSSEQIWGGRELETRDYTAEEQVVMLEESLKSSLDNEAQMRELFRSTERELANLKQELRGVARLFKELMEEES